MVANDILPVLGWRAWHSFCARPLAALPRHCVPVRAGDTTHRGSTHWQGGPCGLQHPSNYQVEVAHSARLLLIAGLHVFKGGDTWGAQVEAGWECTGTSPSECWRQGDSHAAGHATGHGDAGWCTSSLPSNAILRCSLVHACVHCCMHAAAWKAALNARSSSVMPYSLSLGISTARLRCWRCTML